MDRMQERTHREERESDPTCWECGDVCAELTQAPWTAQRMLIGSSARARGRAACAVCAKARPRDARLHPCLACLMPKPPQRAETAHGGLVEDAKALIDA